MGFLDAVSRFFATPDYAGDISQALGGSVHQRDRKQQIICEYNGYSVRITLDDEWMPVVEVRLKQKINVFNLHLQYDERAAKEAREELDRTDWDDADNKDRKVFFSPHVFLEGRGDDLRRYKTFLEQMPDNLLARVVELLESKSNAMLTIRHLFIFSDKIQLNFDDSYLVKAKDGPAQMGGVVDLLTFVATAAETYLA